MTEIKRRRLQLRDLVSSILVVLVAIVIAPQLVQATAVEAVGPEELVQEAELVFEGVVTAVEYRMSDVRTPDDVALPHTFVTFAIKQTFKGKAAGDSYITLRFQGGPEGNGLALLIPGVPLFDVGERAILFARGNGTTLCPLVGWEQGRLRVIGEAVYTDDGEELWITQKGEWFHGPQHALDEVVKHNLAGMQLTLQASPGRMSWVPSSGAQRLHRASIQAAIRGLVSRLHTSEELARQGPVISAESQEPFYVSALPSLAPPAVPASSTEPSSVHEQDLMEEPPAGK